jgi:hypothetical protein
MKDAESKPVCWKAKEYGLGSVSACKLASELEGRREDSAKLRPERG